MKDKEEGKSREEDAVEGKYFGKRLGFEQVMVYAGLKGGTGDES